MGRLDFLYRMDLPHRAKSVYIYLADRANKDGNRLENEKLSALRDALLPKLMSGELDVSNIQL